MRLVTAIVLFMFSLAYAGEFKATAQMEGEQIRKVGDEIVVKVSGEHPEDYVIAAWKIGAYLPFLPGKFADKVGLKVNVNSDPKWSGVMIVPWKWLSAEESKSDEQQICVKTEGWPKGDYSLQCTLLIRVKDKPEVATDKYVTANFVFSLE